MGARFWSTAGGLTLAFAILDLAAVLAADEKTVAGEAVFEMRERSELTVEPGPPGRMLTWGQYVQCGDTPLAEVKAYPKLKSKHPLYGKVKFDLDPTNRQGIEFCFVLDESGEVETGEQKKNDGNQHEQANEEKVRQKAEEKKPAGALLGDLGLGIPRAAMEFGRRPGCQYSGFPRAIASDLAARPEHCGAPVVDVDGRVVGLLIACAPFIERLILPSTEVKAAVEVMRKSAAAKN